MADINGLAGELQDRKARRAPGRRRGIGQQLGLSEEELAARLRRAIRNVDKK